MIRLDRPKRAGASVARRGLLAGGLATGLALGLAGCGRDPPLTASRTPALDMDVLNRDVGALAARALPGVLGVGLMNLESGEHFTIAGDRPFPMADLSMLPLACAALAEVDAGRLSLTEALAVTGETLSPPPSPIADAWPAHAQYSVDQLLVAALRDGDNTAADILMRRIGGPGAVTAWLTAQRIFEVRVDRYTREVATDMTGMASFREAWKGAPAFAQAMATVAPAMRRAAALAYLADPRDTATPRSTLNLLGKLDASELISPAATRKLLRILLANPQGADRIRAGLPPGARFAHKPGASATDQGLTAACNDAGIFTLKDRRSYAACAFLAGSTASPADRARLFADVGRAMAKNLG